MQTAKRLYNVGRQLLQVNYNMGEGVMVSKEMYELIDQLERSGDWSEIDELIEKIQKLQEVEK